jgi:hypothetical protein
MELHSVMMGSVVEEYTASIPVERLPFPAFLGLREPEHSLHQLHQQTDF